jgi:phage replication-related protein YjqB (UPF0714/DUF867 family)
MTGFAPPEGVSMAALPADATVENPLGAVAQPTLYPPTYAYEEHCSVTCDVLTAIDRKQGHQVRVNTATGEFALYTVSQEEEVPEPDTMSTPPAPPCPTVRMGLEGAKRLGITPEPPSSPAFTPFPVTVDPTCVDVTQTLGPVASDAECGLMMTEPEKDAKEHNTLIERVCDDRTYTGLIVIAPHGGIIEEHTDDQAVRVATILKAKNVSLWLCKGWKPPGSEVGWASVHWHITSTDIHEESFTGLKFNNVISRGFNHAVSFHGFTHPGDTITPHVCIGGITTDPTLLEDIRTSIQSILPSDMKVEVYTPTSGAEICKKFSGNNDQNIVNRLGTNGVQIEQSKTARDVYWEAIACAVAGIYVSRI